MSTQSTPALAGLVAHWRDEHGLERLLASWPHDDPRFELVIVDNSRSTASLPLRRNAPASVRWVDPEDNLGFAGAVNRASRETAAPALLVLNPDAAPRPAALDALLEGLAAHPEAAGLVPRLVDPGGEHGRATDSETAQWPWQLRRLPKAFDLIRMAWFLPTRLGPAREPAATATIEQPAAAALLVRRSAFERLGGFDERFHPAWFEDVDLAARAKKAGERFLYWPAAVFEHARAGSVSALGFVSFLWFHHRNLERYARRHHGMAFALSLRVHEIAGAVVRCALLVVRRPRRARSRAEAARAYVGVVLGAATGWRRPQALAAATRSRRDPAPSKDRGGDTR